MNEQTRRSAGAGLEVLAATLTGVTIAAAFGGPLRLEALGTSLTVRTLSRPLLAVALLVGIRLWLARRPHFPSELSRVVARVTLGAILAAGVTGWLAFLSTTCGGADSYGYVSAGGRLLSGQLVQPEPLARVLPFENPTPATCPLGYVPSGRVPDACAPAYPLGLPALMAAAQAVLGANGPFFIAPLAGLVLVLASYVTALGWYRDREVALFSCAMLTVNPLVFTYAIQPMSDVPAAAAVAIAISLLSRQRAPFAAGVAAAAALLIRPALALVSSSLVLVIVSSRRENWKRSAAAYLAPVAAAVLAQLWSQWYLYGQAFGSGYGPIAGLFSLGTAGTNLRTYAYWGWLALGPVWLAGVALGLAASTRQPRLIIALVTGPLTLAYLFYRPFDHWETLRFVMPAVTTATAAAAFGVVSLARRLAGLAGGGLIAAALAVALAANWVSWMSANQVFTMPAHERRHELAGGFVSTTTPADAVVLALQHSGSLRYYAERSTLLWDRIPPGRLLESVQALQETGRRVYLLIDSEAERQLFEARHGPILADNRWLPAGQVRSIQLFEAVGRP